MWVVRWRIGVAFLGGLTVAACDAQTRSPTLNSTGGDAATISSLLPPGDAGADAHAEAGPCAPPFDCGDASTFDAAPPTKDGATTADFDATVDGLCPSARIPFDSRALKASGPTPAFASAYNAALASAAFGPFVIEIAGADVAEAAKHTVTLAGIAPVNGKTADTTEPGASLPYTLTQTGAGKQLQIAKGEKDFHLAFTRSLNPQGDIAAAGFELAASLDDSGCSSLPSATATLYIAQSQASVPFGGSTLGQLLGPTNTTLASGPGWAIALSGSAPEIFLQ